MQHQNARNFQNRVRYSAVCNVVSEASVIRNWIKGTHGLVMVPSRPFSAPPPLDKFLDENHVPIREAGGRINNALLPQLERNSISMVIFPPPQLERNCHSTAGTTSCNRKETRRTCTVPRKKQDAPVRHLAEYQVAFETTCPHGGHHQEAKTPNAKPRPRVAVPV